MMNRLTAVKVQKIAGRGRYADGGGLYLQVSEWGTKAWLFRYKLDGKARQMGLGSVNTFSLAEARERARLARQLLADHLDPIDARRGRRMQGKAEAAKQVRFKEAAEKYIAAHRAGWKSDEARRAMGHDARDIRLSRGRRPVRCGHRNRARPESARTDLDEQDGNREPP